jgi:hypothetical protein
MGVRQGCVASDVCGMQEGLLVLVVSSNLMHKPGIVRPEDGSRCLAWLLSSADAGDAVRAQERRRIEKAGGMVSQMRNREGRQVGPHRVFGPSGTSPGLAMARSLGDLMAHQFGVSTEPTTYTRQLTSADQFVVRARTAARSLFSLPARGMLPCCDSERGPVGRTLSLAYGCDLLVVVVSKCDFLGQARSDAPREPGHHVA